MFTWKQHKYIFKGEGIYHLTFVVHNRAPLLGTLVGDASSARVDLSAIGIEISRNIQNLPSFFPAIKVCAKLLMPDHIHVVLWVQREQPHSIKEVARSMRQAWHKIILAHCRTEEVIVYINPQIQSAGDNKSEKITLPYRFEPPFIRTLSRKGQLSAVIAYIHDNPRRAMLRRLNPDLFRLRRELRAGGLTFTALGNLFLLDYPQRQAVECSRSASADMITARQTAVIQAAENGAVTYSGAISEGEKQIVRAVRQSLFPVVVLLNDGFPTAGSVHEKYYKPGGVYFEACAAGRLLLLEPTAATLEDPRVVALTDQALRGKAEAGQQAFIPLPHSSLRWKMMANNTIVKLLVEGDCSIIL